MRLKPNDSPVMELGEARNFEFRLAAAVGANSITDFDISSPNLTFGTPAVTGTTVTVLVTASTVGTHPVIATADLTSAETVKGFVRVKVIDSSVQCRTDGYD